MKRVMSNSAIPRTLAHQVPLSMELYKQESRSGLPFPSPGDLPYPGVKPGSPTLQADSLPSEQPGKPHLLCICCLIRIKSREEGNTFKA